MKFFLRQKPSFKTWLLLYLDNYLKMLDLRNYSPNLRVIVKVLGTIWSWWSSSKEKIHWCVTNFRIDLLENFAIFLLSHLRRSPVFQKFNWPEPRTPLRMKPVSEFPVKFWEIFKRFPSEILTQIKGWIWWFTHLISLENITFILWKYWMFLVFWESFQLNMSIKPPKNFPD